MESSDDTTSINELKMIVDEFVKERDWEKFHTPKNIASSISIEAAELLEIYQWDLENQPNYSNNEQKERTEEELADVLIYCLSLANVLKIDISSSVRRKIALNEKRYPAAKFKGVYHKPEREK